MMKTACTTLLLLLIGFCMDGETLNAKKSIANMPWPGYPFRRPPSGYFATNSSEEEDEFYEDYDLGVTQAENDIDDDLKSDKKATPAFKIGVASAMHDFTFDLYREMAKNWTDRNGMFSPMSIYTAIGMLSIGLGGNSRAQAMQILRAQSLADLNTEMNQMNSVIFRKRSDVDVTSANRVYVDKSIKLLKPFKQRMKDDYGVTAKKVNFQRSPELNRIRINAYVAKHTHKKVKQLAPKGSITKFTRLFIINAMYLKASWKTMFYRSIKGDFTTSPGKTVQADMMQTNGGNCYSEFSNELEANVVRIEMKGDLSMIIIVPSVAGDFANIEGAQGQQRVRRALEMFYNPEYEKYPQMCRITMPKFKIQTTATDLIDSLKTVGMSDVFDPYRADLTNMTPGPGRLFVSDMRHKATIDVNEKGLEAAAATSIGISARMMPQFVSINKPFFFIVRDDNTGANFFTGKLVKPEYK